MKNAPSLQFFLILFLFHSVCFAQQKTTIDSLTKIIANKPPKDKQHIDALNSLAWLYSKTDAVKATAYANSAQQASTAQNYTLGLAEAYKALGNVNSFKNKTPEAVAQFNTSNTYYVKLNNKREIGGNYNNIGMAYKLVGNLKEALPYFLKAEKLHREINDLQALAGDLNNIGTVYYDLDSYDTAIKYYITATKITEQINRPKENAQTFINIGNVLKLQKNYESSILYYQKAVKILTGFNDQLNLGIAYLNFANVYIEQSAYDKGIELLDLSLAAFNKVNFKRGIQICYNNLGVLYLRKESYSKAISIFEQSIKIAEEAKNFAGLALVQQNIGFAYTKMGQFKAAEEWFDAAEASATKYNKGNVSTWAEIYNHRSTLDSAMGNFQKAFITRDKYRLIKDSLLNEKLGKQINELNTKYETEKKENQISLLGKENKIQGLELSEKMLALQNKSLENDRNLYQIGTQNLLIEKNEALLTQKQIETKAKAQQIKLLAVQNEVQQLELLKRNIFLGIAIFSLFIVLLLGFLFYRSAKLKQEARLQATVVVQQDLATKAVLNAEENERQRISGELHDGLGQMFSVVKMNLSSLTDDIKFGDEKSKVIFDNTLSLVDESCKEVRVISHQMAPNVLLKSGLAAAIKDFISKIDARKLKVNLETTGLQDRLEQNVETVLYRVIQESVNNVIKHAEANILHIQLTKDEEGVNVMIEDNGKGFDIQAMNKFEGIGLKNIKTRVEYLKGSVDFSSSVGEGTLVAIYIPL